MMLAMAAAILLLLSIQQAAAYIGNSSSSSNPLFSPANYSSSQLGGAHPRPDAAAEQLMSKVEKSTMGRALQIASGVGGGTDCQTGNPIDDCWLCDADWRSNRKRLADCAVGFGRNAVGGRDGQEYVVNDPSDDSPSDPKPGTLRHAALQTEPLWIVFAGNMTITLSEDLLVGSFKTIDGRGADVHVTGAGCFYLKKVNNVIIHNIYIHDCVRSRQDGDGITVRESRDVWIDHCTLWSCRDGLIDVTHASTMVTISNNHFHHHVKVMLLGHSDNFPEDVNMQVTVAFNRFGEESAERMPRCRFGFFHVVNNDYVGWTLYAVGGSSNSTINSQGNRFAALAGGNKKEVTRRMHAKESEWRRWNWRSQGDLLLNGAVFTDSGDPNEVFYQKATSFKALPVALVGSITKNAGVLGDIVGGVNGNCGSSTGLGPPPGDKNPNNGGDLGALAGSANSGNGENVGNSGQRSTRPWSWSWTWTFSAVFLAFVYPIVGYSARKH